MNHDFLWFYYFNQSIFTFSDLRLLHICKLNEDFSVTACVLLIARTKHGIISFHWPVVTKQSNYHSYTNVNNIQIVIYHYEKNEFQRGGLHFRLTIKFSDIATCFFKEHTTHSQKFPDH